MLALVWAVKYFRCYILGRKFLVRTDHSALSYLRKFADNNSRLMRWSLKLTELDFIVQHRPGSKIGYVDALSRHVSALMNESSLDKELILQEQQKDEFCTKQSPGPTPVNATSLLMTTVSCIDANAMTVIRS